MTAPSAPVSALVTGATSGIGRATALRLAGAGFEVLVHGRDADRGGEVVSEIERAGGRARFVAADLGDPEDVQRLIDDGTARGGMAAKLQAALSALDGGVQKVRISDITAIQQLDRGTALTRVGSMCA